MQEMRGLDRRRFCGAAAATVAAGPLGLPDLLFHLAFHVDCGGRSRSFADL